MKRIVALIALIAGSVWPGLAQAEDVQATLVKALGKGQVVLAGGAAGEYKAGTLLRAGSRVVTEDNGLAVLMLEDGTQVSLGPNSDLGINEMSKTGASRSTIFDLVKGLFRATVNKLTVGSRFEVNTPDAVAAVKGTDYEIRCDDKGTDVRVREGRVWLEDKKREKRLEVAARRSARADRGKGLGEERKLKKDELVRFMRWDRVKEYRDGEAPGKEDCRYFDDKELDRRERRAFEHWIKSEAKGKDVGVSEEEWERLRPEERINLVRGKVWNAAKGAFDQATEGDEHTVLWEMQNLRDEERQERWKEKLRSVDARHLASEEARVDLVLRKSMIDVKGRRVRFDEFIVRPAKDEVRFINYTKREGRTDVMAAWNKYNTNLPDRLWEARGMNNRVWHQLLAPTYWVTESHVVFGNDANDSLAGNSHFFDPVRITGLCGCTRWELPVQSTELRANVPDIRFPEVGGRLLEGYERYDYVGGVVVASPSGRVTGSTTMPSGGNVASGQNMVSSSRIQGSDLAWTGGIGNTGVNAGVWPVSRLLPMDELSPSPDHKLKAGDFADGFKRTYADGTWLALKTWAIDENGQIRNIFDELKDKPILDAYLNLAFKTYQELNLSTSLWGSRDIDVVSQMLWWSTITKTKDRL